MVHHRPRSFLIPSAPLLSILGPKSVFKGFSSNGSLPSTRNNPDLHVLQQLAILGSFLQGSIIIYPEGLQLNVQKSTLVPVQRI